MKTHLLVSLRMTVALVILTCGVYPLAVFAVGQLAFPRQANGSMIASGGRVVGSELIGQPFTSERFFRPRPSASGYDPTASGGTNLGPTSRRLRDDVASAVQAFDVHAGVPADAVTSSGSGLDPHISPADARAQAPRVARARGLPLASVLQLIDRNVEGRFAGLFGEPRVNVLRLNIALAEAGR